MLHTLSLTLQVVLHQGSLELLAELLEGWLVQQLIPFQFYPQGNILNNAGKEKGRERGRGKKLQGGGGQGIWERGGKEAKKEGNIDNLVGCLHSDERMSGGIHLVFQVQLLCHC